MASYVPVVKNGANGAIFYVGLVDQSNTKLLKSSPTLATGDFKVSIDGGALANLGTTPTVTPAAGRQVKITLSQAEVNGDNITVQCVDAAGAEWCDLIVNIQTVARQIDDLAFPATSGRSMVVDASGLVDANTVKVGPTGSGTAQTARDVGASVLLSTGTGTGQLDFTSGVVKANATQWLGGTIPAVNVTGVPLVDLKYTLGTISPATAGSVRADAVTGAVGSVTGAVGSVTGNVGGNVVGSVASVTARVTANTDQLAGQTVTAAAGVTFPTSVASPTNITAGTITTATNVTTVNGLAAGVITAASIATDAIDADALAADAVTEIQSGLSTLTAAGVRTAVGLASANLDTQLAAVQADTDDIQTRLPAALVAGKMDSHVNDIAADAITASAVATDAFGALELAAGAASEIGTAVRTELATELARIDVATSTRLATAGYTAPPTVGAIADQVWDEVLSGHLTATTTGAALNAAGAAGDPWVTSLPGAYGAGTAGFIVGTNIDALISSRTKPADTQAAVTTVTNLTNAPTAGDLTATMKASVTTAATAATPTVAGVSGVTFPASVASPTNITAGTITTVTNLTNAPTAGDLTATMKTSVTTAATAATPTAAAVTGAVGSVTGNVGGNLVGNVNGNVVGSVGSVTVVSDKTGYRLSTTGVNDILDDAIDGTTTLRESIRLHNAALGGKASGLATTNALYRDLADSKDRIDATVDADGNRSVVTLDLSP